MKISRKLLPLLVIIPALLACNLTSLAGVGPSSSPAASGNTPAPASQEQIQSLNEEESQVRNAVTGFLSALQNDPTAAGAQTFLSPTLQQQVSAGTSPATLGGLQGTVPAFELSAVTFAPDAGRAFVDASLLYAEPLNTRFELVKTGDGWKIDSITSQQGDAGYPSSPEMVVQIFLTAYQEAPDQMNQFLSASRLEQLPPGGAVGMLNINGSLEGSMIDSAAVNPDPPMAAITVSMRVGGEDVTRVFSLIKEGGRWKITNIE